MSYQNRNFAAAPWMMKRTILVVLLVGAVAMAGTGSAAAQIADADNERGRRGPSITVSGEGEVQAKPNMVAINVGVVTEAENAQQALASNSEAMQQLFTVLDRQNIAENDRQTTRFDVSPQYRQEDPDRPGPRGPRDVQAGPPREPRIVGYQVTNEVRIKLRDISRLGAILDAVVGAGSNRIHGIEFSIDDQDALKDDSRRDAIRRARAKAELLAEAAGATVGKVITIEEDDFPRPMPHQQYAMMEARSAPIAEGEQTISARVHVTFRLEVESD